MERLTEWVQDLSNSLSVVVFSFFAKMQYCFWVFPFAQDPFENDGEFPCCTRLLRVEHSRMESLLWLDLALKLQGPQPFFMHHEKFASEGNLVAAAAIALFHKIA
jgi:hypothetical protein